MLVNIFIFETFYTFSVISREVSSPKLESSPKSRKEYVFTFLLIEMSRNIITYTALEITGGQGSMTPHFHDLTPQNHLRAVNLTAQVLTK